MVRFANLISPAEPRADDSGCSSTSDPKLDSRTMAERRGRAATLRYPGRRRIRL